ncbi:hypothetical protein SY83_21585 [Paenibacillus swuensis]|uniref:Exlusion protein FxsA n=1 Tax=Paenibacillus swuensis TaxID=1178515 RepID=A0A172TN88_9BACL|nr:FxsA family protein [Paenibacillus swuensis]ANE48442.1 hypothetical protein SY83_21585 [Paenibacillus swuensis]
MFRIIVVLMVVVPALEIWGMLTMGRLIGGWQTFVFILMTGFVGAFLAKREARKVLAAAREQMQSGQVPGTPILDGICILVGGLLLLTPGFITDLLGFMLVFPLTRPLFRAGLQAFIQKKLSQGDRNLFKFTWR